MIADCEYCAEIIKDVEGALFDGTYWFCSYSCRGQWVEQQGGRVPA